LHLLSLVHHLACLTKEDDLEKFLWQAHFKINQIPDVKIL
jgi:hypothetical protein